MVFVGCCNGDKLELLWVEIEVVGGMLVLVFMDVCEEKSVIDFFNVVNEVVLLEVVIFNFGVNVNYFLFDMIEWVFFKVWEMVCKFGFLMGCEVVCIMLEYGCGLIFFMGVMVSMCGGIGYVVFVSVKGGLCLMV